MTEFHTISDAAAALRCGETTSLALATAAIGAAETRDNTLGSFVARFTDRALEDAEAADRQFAAGLVRSPLQGIPIGIKDIISTSDRPAAAQSLVLDPDWGRVVGDAVVVQRIRAAGALVMGTTSTGEFAIGTPDFDRHFPIPRHPWDSDYWPGGSSSGSASAVAAGMSLGAIGTDSGGSVRLPAAFCGVTGLKPTFGRVPKSGCVPLGYSIDHIGTLSRSGRDAAIMLSALAGHDSSDASSIVLPVPDYLSTLNGDLEGVRIGVARMAGHPDIEDPGLDRLFRAAVGELASVGAQLHEIDLPLYDQLTDACFVTLVAEAAAYHLPDLRRRWSDYSPSARRVLGMAAGLTATDYVQAQRVRRVAQQEIAGLFSAVDLVVCPTAARGAYRLSELDCVLAESRSATHTAYWNAAGNPVVSVPIGVGASAMPLAMQIAGKPFDEQLVLRAADAYQVRTRWHLMNSANGFCAPPTGSSDEL